MRTLIVLILVVVAGGVVGMAGMLGDELPWSRRGSIESPSPITTEPPRRREVSGLGDGEVVGEWRDTIGSWTQRIRIVKQSQKYLRETHYPNGKVNRDYLNEVEPHADEERRFENPSSEEGQIYAIKRNGRLVIYDEQGFVTQARRVNNRKGE